jgi:hypothetical protein
MLTGPLEHAQAKMTEAHASNAQCSAHAHLTALACRALIEAAGGLLDGCARKEVQEPDGTDVTWTDLTTGDLIARGCYFARDADAAPGSRENEVVLCQDNGQILFLGSCADQLFAHGHSPEARDDAVTVSVTWVRSVFRSRGPSPEGS